MEVLDVKIRWNLQWGNLPDVQLLVDEHPPSVHDQVHHAFHHHQPVGGATLITRQEPCVRFVYVEKTKDGPHPGNGRGALTGDRLVEGDGIWHVTSGWSSNEGAINRLRKEVPAVAELLPFEIADASVYRPDPNRPGGWELTGMAGYSWDVPWLKEQVEKFCQGVTLFPMSHEHDAWMDRELSAEQTAIVAGHQGYGWVPYPVRAFGYKPRPTSEVFLTTATLHDLESEVRVATDIMTRVQLAIDGRKATHATV